MRLFDLQFSALNHPDSSAAMRLSRQEMHFFSFGFYHHDLCLVKHDKLKDGQYRLNAELLASGAGCAGIRCYPGGEQGELGVRVRDGRLITSTRSSPGQRAFCV